MVVGRVGKTYNKRQQPSTLIMSSSTKPLREVVRQLAETFNDPKIRELSYFDFYDDSLTIYGFPPNLPANKEGFKQFIYLLWKGFPDIRIIFEDFIIEGNKVAVDIISLAHTKVNLWIFSQPISNSKSMA